MSTKREEELVRYARDIQRLITEINDCVTVKEHEAKIAEIAQAILALTNALQTKH